MLAADGENWTDWGIGINASVGNTKATEKSSWMSRLAFNRIDPRAVDRPVPAVIAVDFHSQIRERAHKENLAIPAHGALPEGFELGPYPPVHLDQLIPPGSSTATAEKFRAHTMIHKDLLITANFALVEHINRFLPADARALIVDIAAEGGPMAYIRIVQALYTRYGHRSDKAHTRKVRDVIALITKSEVTSDLITQVIGEFQELDSTVRTESLLCALLAVRLSETVSEDAKIEALSASIFAEYETIKLNKVAADFGEIQRDAPREGKPQGYAAVAAAAPAARGRSIAERLGDKPRAPRDQRPPRNAGVNRSDTPRWQTAARSKSKPKRMYVPLGVYTDDDGYMHCSKCMKFSNPNPGPGNAQHTPENCKSAEASLREGGPARKAAYEEWHSLQDFDRRRSRAAGAAPAPWHGEWEDDDPDFPHRELRDFERRHVAANISGGA
jgi:hypothetical protein